ncbi:MAG: aldehyde dehydrogenase family protein [Bradymonadaceae bacterium]|nr:aldehyde dehydrogenase family protein [Lujinxingiaceae bacterium]
MNTAELDAKIAILRDNKDSWARLPIARKIEMAKKLIETNIAIGERQVAAAIAAKKIPADSPLVGEEWLGGPVITVRNLRLLVDSLEDVAAFGTPKLKPNAARTRPDGQVVVDVFPMSAWDKLMYQGFTAEVWMEPGVNANKLADTMAVFYKEDEPSGKVALVLGAGNVASIGPLDVVYKLFAEGQVCMLKMNPVNEYLGPFIEESFAEFIEAGYLQMAYGGADVGAYLCQHELIDEIHITGSDKTHDAIVYGVGEAGQKRKAADERLVDKRITSELGNVSPIIVVPGPWSESDLRFQAANISTQLANNGGFNCNAARVIINHDNWNQRDALLDAVRATLRSIPSRVAYYPGAEERYEAFVGANETAERLGRQGAGVLPWTLIPDVKCDDTDNICFTTESFCGVVAETALPGEDALDFLRRAVNFCNDHVWGTLSASIIIHPETQRELGSALESAIAELRYGSIVVNHWPALSYGLGVTTWGAHPGHTFDDIQSGIGVVHNTFLFDKPQKSVIYGPFRVAPTPAWFITNKNTHRIASRLLHFEGSPGVFKLVNILSHAIRG